MELCDSYFWKGIEKFSWSFDMSGLLLFFNSFMAWIVSSLLGGVILLSSYPDDDCCPIPGLLWDGMDCCGHFLVGEGAIGSEYAIVRYDLICL